MASAEATARARAVAQRFGRRARDYARHAHLQRRAAETLDAFIAAQGGLPDAGRVLEVGCGTGLLTRLLHRPGRDYLATDLSPAMLAQARQELGERPGLAFAVLDGERAALPSPPAAIVSNLACQWFGDPVAGIVRLAGQTPFFAFAVPLAGSFPEWEAAFAELGRTSGLLPMPSESDILHALSALPGLRVRHRVEVATQRFPDAKAFADSFRRIGADRPREGYRPGPIRPVLRRFASGLDATARILYCLARRDGT